MVTHKQNTITLNVDIGTKQPQHSPAEDQKHGLLLHQVFVGPVKSSYLLFHNSQCVGVGVCVHVWRVGLPSY